MCQRRSGFHSSIGQPFFARSTSARSRTVGSNRLFSTFAISRSQVVVLAPMKFSRLRRSRFSLFEEPKSHAAKVAYVSSIMAPLTRVNDEATWDRVGGFMRCPGVHTGRPVRLTHHVRTQAQAM